MRRNLTSLVTELNRPVARLVVGALVAIALLALVLNKVSIPRVEAALGHVSVPLLALAAVIAVAYVAMRAWRYHLLLGRGSWFATMGVTAASWGAGQVLPGPGSDAAFVWFARSDLDASVSRGTGAALVARLLDLASLAMVLLVSADLAGVRLPRPVRISAIAMAVGLVVLLVLFFVRQSRAWLLARAERLPVLGSFAVRAEVALADLSSSRMVAGLVVSTVCARVLAALEYLCFFWALGAHLTIWQVWLALAVRTLLFALPVQGLGGLGTSQVWWAGGLALAGLPLTAALTLGLEVQVLDLVVAIPEGFLGWLALRVRRHTGPGVPRPLPSAATVSSSVEAPMPGEPAGASRELTGSRGGRSQT
ncbi:MAG: lysylphosphatidylglycerol synthase domain-containing protein [Candidatus Dormibacteria bacterium]|jgi:hypothetical protein